MLVITGINAPAVTLNNLSNDFKKQKKKRPVLFSIRGKLRRKTRWCKMANGGIKSENCATVLFASKWRRRGWMSGGHIWLSAVFRITSIRTKATSGNLMRQEILRYLLGNCLAKSRRIAFEIWPSKVNFCVANIFYFEFGPNLFGTNKNKPCNAFFCPV